MRKEVKVKDIGIGAGNPVRVQSMTSTRTEDVGATVAQINALYEAGAEVVRVAVQSVSAVKYFKEIRKETDVPLVADVHFDHRIAIMCAEAGADKIRINPGNIRGPEKVEEVIRALKANRVPARIGVNSGSLEDDLIEKHGGVTPEALAESALRWADFFLERDFEDFVLSVKSSRVPETIKAYRLLASKTDQPLHVGLTEAGPLWPGAIRSSVALGILLEEGIGDTIRVSLTGDPVDEVRVAWEILKSLEKRARGPMIISCPTCGRMRVDILPIVQEITEALKDLKEPIRVAVMGCEVNGPGEAREADFGVASGQGFGLIFRKGRVVKRVKAEDITKALLDEIASSLGQEE
ncbi:MAG: flavodoxin-dependent (E)-4-hydroxy-3-methylbut-2-enyl-diphosphate synthase [candidate division WOR-3 bacterium]